jgi:2-methylcitrate dehydratase PrpD
MDDGLSTSQINSINCYVPIEEAPIISEPWERRLHPSSGYEAKFSLPYCLASLLLDGEVNVRTFDRTSIKEEVVPIARKITYTPLSGTEFPRRFPGHLEVHLTSGQKRSASVSDVKGSSHRPLTSEEIRRKFIDNSQRKLVPEGIERVIEEVYQLDKATDLKLLSKALRSVM